MSVFFRDGYRDATFIIQCDFVVRINRHNVRRVQLMASSVTTDYELLHGTQPTAFRCFSKVFGKPNLDALAHLRGISIIRTSVRRSFEEYLLRSWPLDDLPTGRAEIEAVRQRMSPRRTGDIVEQKYSEAKTRRAYVTFYFPSYVAQALIGLNLQRNRLRDILNDIAATGQPGASLELRYTAIAPGPFPELVALCPILMSILRDGERVRLMIDVLDSEPLWGECYQLQDSLVRQSLVELNCTDIQVCRIRQRNVDLTDCNVLAALVGDFRPHLITVQNVLTELPDPEAFLVTLKDALQASSNHSLMLVSDWYQYHAARRALTHNLAATRSSRSLTVGEFVEGGKAAPFYFSTLLLPFGNAIWDALRIGRPSDGWLSPISRFKVAYRYLESDSSAVTARMDRQMLNKANSQKPLQPEPAALPSPSRNDYRERLTELRLRFTRAYDPWTSDEDALVANSTGSLAHINLIADVLRRQPSAIRSRLRKLRSSPNFSLQSRDARSQDTYTQKRSDFASAVEVTEGNQRQLAGKIATLTTDVEKAALLPWLRELVLLRESSLAPVKKAIKSIILTARSKVIWRVTKLLWSELKRRGWDKTGWAARLGLSAAGIALAIVGGHGAGIAAMGTAIGVPLWIIFGSGAAFAGMLIDLCAMPKKSSAVWRRQERNPSMPLGAPTSRATGALSSSTQSTQRSRAYRPIKPARLSLSRRKSLTYGILRRWARRQMS